MKRSVVRPLFVVILPMPLLLAGCNRGPTRVAVPDFAPAAIAAGAIKAYDVNGDGVVSGDELKKAASITDYAGADARRIDKNGDGQISEEEIENRVRQWVDSQVGIVMFQCTVTLDDQPLEGAKVKYVPESFMGGVIETASATTDRRGIATPTIAPAKLPQDSQGVIGARCGFYRVEISHPSVEIPAKYNTETILGHEVALDSVESVRFVHKLTSE
jgi:hypothetical protein